MAHVKFQSPPATKCPNLVSYQLVISGILLLASELVAIEINGFLLSPSRVHSEILQQQDSAILYN